MVWCTCGGPSRTGPMTSPMLPGHDAGVSSACRWVYEAHGVCWHSAVGMVCSSMWCVSHSHSQSQSHSQTFAQGGSDVVQSPQGVSCGQRRPVGALYCVCFGSLRRRPDRRTPSPARARRESDAAGIRCLHSAQAPSRVYCTRSSTVSRSIYLQSCPG